MHANQLRHFNVRVDEVKCDPTSLSVSDASCSSCAIVYDSDSDFGDVHSLPVCNELDNASLPSAQIAPEKLSHLTETQQQQ